MRWIVLIVRSLGALVFGVIAYLTDQQNLWPESPTSGLMMRAFGLLLFGGLAAVLVYRNLELLTRTLLGRPLLIATTKRLSVWEFLSYRTIGWSQFGGVERTVTSKGGEFLQVLYRPDRPNLLQRWMMSRKDGWAWSQLPLSSVSKRDQLAIEDQMTAARNTAMRS